MSNQKSFVSKSVTNFDTPDIENGEVKFNYQYFVPDEMISKSESEQTNFVFVDIVKNGKVSKKVPRYNSLTFQKPYISNILNPTYGRDIRNSFSMNQSLSEEDLSVINDEGKTSSFAFTGINLQDTGVDGKMYLMVDGAFKQEKDRINTNLTKNASDISDKIIEKLRRIDKNLYDSADVLSKLFSESSDIKFIENSLVNLESLGLQYLDKEKKSNIKQEYFDQIKSFVFNAKINNKFASSIALSAISDGVSVFSDELRQVYPELESRQKLFRTSEDADKIKSVDYLSYLENDGIQDIRTDVLYRPTVKIVGYIVEKRRLLPSGAYLLENVFILSGENSTLLNDSSVVYGAHYSYTVKVIYEVRAKCNTIVEGGPDSASSDVQLKTASFLISSKASRNFSVTCIENIPPEPIEDLNIEWDHKTDFPILYWSFPRNPYSDIKGFQIFVRSGNSVDGKDSPFLKSFKLIKEINFDNSIIPYKRRENIPSNLIDRVNVPVTYYIDKGFDKDLIYVYSVCTVDAHGLTSGYSEQYLVGYDRFRGRLTKQRISEKGAPKQYPNLNFDMSVFENFAKISGTEKIKIFFNPDALSAVESKDLDLKGIKTDVPYVSSTQKDAGFYIVNVVNLDNQESEKITVQINIEEKQNKVRK